MIWTNGSLPILMGPGSQKRRRPRRSPLIERAMSPLAVQLMLKRRLKTAGLPGILSRHSFRVLVVTDLLSQNVLFEDVQYLTGHTHPRTTQIYDRRCRCVSRNLVERISV